MTVYRAAGRCRPACAVPVVVSAGGGFRRGNFGSAGERRWFGELGNSFLKGENWFFHERERESFGEILSNDVVVRERERKREFD